MIGGEWIHSRTVELWRRELTHRIGCSADEVAERTGILLRLCRALRLSPDRMIDECRGDNRRARRRFFMRAARRTEANLVVQSFLVHNGINIFGDIVCMPATASAVVEEQGEQWILRRTPVPVQASGDAETGPRGRSGR